MAFEICGGCRISLIAAGFPWWLSDSMVADFSVWMLFVWFLELLCLDVVLGTGTIDMVAD